MPLLYWALEDIQQTTIADGFVIVTKTDVACHQWLRHTLVSPQKHAKPVFRRGLFIMYDARFCFVAFEDLEQDEAGDTLIHTFTWHGWVHCQTRYFYFWATSEGGKMKSTSPIFSKHFIAPKIFTALCDIQDYIGDSVNWAHGYNPVHESAGWKCRDTLTWIISMQQRGSGDWWFMDRSALVLDTTALPPWSFTKATLCFTPRNLYHADGGPYDFVNANGVTLPCIATAFSELADKTAVVASVPRADLTVNVEHCVDLLPSGLSVINPGGLTIIGVREHHELLKTDGGQGSGQTWGINIWSCEEAGKEPYLVIYGE